MKNETLSSLIDSLRDWKSQTRSEILLTMAKIQDAIKREKPEQPPADPTPLEITPEYAWPHRIPVEAS